LGDAGHYPAIDVLQSVSRLTARVATREQQEAARKVREAMAIYQQSEDLIQLGAYAAGSNPRLDASIRAREGLLNFLRQDARVSSPREETLAGLNALAASLS
jgi:flagellum-specific ATP synthase/type III secretion protein N (ATPase)